MGKVRLRQMSCLLLDFLPSPPHLLTPVLIKSTEMSTISSSLSLRRVLYVCVSMTASERVMLFCASVHSSLVWCCQLLMRAKQWGIETGSAIAVICQLAWGVNEGDCGKSRAQPHTCTFAPSHNQTLGTIAKVCTHLRTWMHEDKQMDAQPNIHISTLLEKLKESSEYWSGIL